MSPSLPPLHGRAEGLSVVKVVCKPCHKRAKNPKGGDAVNGPGSPRTEGPLPSPQDAPKRAHDPSAAQQTPYANPTKPLGSHPYLHRTYHVGRPARVRACARSTYRASDPGGANVPTQPGKTLRTSPTPRNLWAFGQRVRTTVRVLVRKNSRGCVFSRGYTLPTAWHRVCTYPGCRRASRKRRTPGTVSPLRVT